MRQYLARPDHLPVVAIELDERVGLWIRPGPARAPGELVRSGPRRRVCHVDVDSPVVVECRGVPEPAATVDVHMRRAPEVLGDGPVLPFRLAGFGVECPEHARAVALVELLRVPGHGRD